MAGLLKISKGEWGGCSGKDSVKLFRQMQKCYRPNLYGYRGQDSYRGNALAVLRELWVRARDSELYLRWQLFDGVYLQAEGNFSTCANHPFTACVRNPL